VVRIVDGDTIIVRRSGRGPKFSDESPQARVRLLGIDAPETVQPNHPIEPWGPEASEFAREFLSAGEVELRLDRRRKDRYNRFLAYVYVKGRVLNEELVQAGLARAVHYPGDSPTMARRLRSAEAAAQNEKRGIWSE
jgi:micrococcal nuclease